MLSAVVANAINFPNTTYAQMIRQQSTGTEEASTSIQNIHEYLLEIRTSTESNAHLLCFSSNSASE
jgi:methyl-accepting chemotaxis protein